MGNINTNGSITASEGFVGDLSGTSIYSKYLAQQNMSNKNLNDLTRSGYYYGYTNMTNAPCQTIAVMEVIVYSQDWIIQRFTVITPDMMGRYWTRCRHSGTTWTDWKLNVDADYGSSLPTSNLYAGRVFFKI